MALSQFAVSELLEAFRTVSKAVVVATGVTADGRREILGLDVRDSEDEVFWRTFLTSLKKRGLAGVQLVISDQHAGLVAALTRGKDMALLYPDRDTGLVAAINGSDR